MTGNISGDEAINAAFVGFHGIEEFDLRSSLHEKTFADNIPENAAVSSENEIARAFHAAGEIALNRHVMALDHGSGDNTFFVDENVSPGL